MLREIVYRRIKSIVAEFFLENLLDTILDIVIVLDINGVIIMANKRVAQLLPLKLDDIIGRHIDCILSSSVEYGTENNEWYKKCGEPLNARLVYKDSEVIPLELYIRRLRGHKNAIFLITGSDVRLQHQLITQVAERESMLRQIALSEKKFQNMFIHNSSGILIIDIENELITDANPAAGRIFEKSVDDLYGKTLVDLGLRITEEKWIDYLEAILLYKVLKELRFEFQLHMDKMIICKVSISTIEINQRLCMMLDIADITMSENMTAALMQKQKLETVGILAGGIAHDFNNILAVILGQIGIAKIKNKQYEVEKALNESEKACLRAREMTQVLLTFSRGGQPVLSLFDPSFVIAESAEFILKNYIHVQCTFTFSERQCIINADKIQFSQIVSNLVYNAIHAVNEAGTICVQMEFVDFAEEKIENFPVCIGGTKLEAKKYMKMCITDTGYGLEPALVEKIFEPFFTLKKKGNGMGLAIVLSIIKQHGGAISVHSVLHEGTEFSVFIPAEEKTFVEPAFVSSNLPQKKRILVMDDDTAVRQTLSEILTALNYEVTTVANGERAISAYICRLNENPYSAVILDLIVPNGMGGVETAAELRNIDEHAVLLVSSGYSEDPVLADFRSYHFDGVIQKPYMIGELQKKLQMILRDM